MYTLEQQYQNCFKLADKFKLEFIVSNDSNKRESYSFGLVINGRVRITRKPVKYEILPLMVRMKCFESPLLGVMAAKITVLGKMKNDFGVLCTTTLGTSVTKELNVAERILKATLEFIEVNTVKRPNPNEPQLDAKYITSLTPDLMTPFLTTNDEPPKTPSESKSCPKCLSPMVRRTSKFGPFFGCTKYPKCKGTRKISS